MKNILITLLPILTASCATHNDQPKMIGMANPASVYCQKIGGKLDIVNESAGEVGYCTLSNGERIEEWTLYRRDNE